MTLKDIKAVPAKEFKLRFGAFREAALTEPIGITNHGRISTVMISAREFEEFERLKKYDTRQASTQTSLMKNCKPRWTKGTWATGTNISIICWIDPA